MSADRKEPETLPEMILGSLKRNEDQPIIEGVKIQLIEKGDRNKAMYNYYVLRGMQAGEPIRLEGEIDQERCPGVDLRDGRALLSYLVESVNREECTAGMWQEAELTASLWSRDHHYIFVDERWKRGFNEATLRNRAFRGFLLGFICLLSLLLFIVLLYIVSNVLPPNPNDASYVPPDGWIAAEFVSLIIALVTSIIGAIFSLRGLKSTTRKGFARIGLVLSMTLPIVWLGGSILSVITAAFAR